MDGGLDGLWQVAFTFNAKVMATSPEAGKGHTMFAVVNNTQVWGHVCQWQVAANAMQVIAKFVSATMAYCW